MIEAVGILKLLGLGLCLGGGFIGFIWFVVILELMRLPREPRDDDL